MHDPKEHLQVTRPVAHLDTLICLTMEPVSDEEIAAPNYLEREFQWSFFSLHVPNANQIDFRPKPTNLPSSPGTFYAEDVLALLPAGTIIVDRRPSTQKQADETTYKEWAALPKITQINLSGLATKTVRTPGFKVKITRYAPYNLDTILSHEPPADDTEYIYESPVPSQTPFPAAVASSGHQEAAAAVLNAFSVDGDGNEMANLGDATDLAGYHQGASNSFSKAYNDITVRRTESWETRDIVRNKRESDPPARRQHRNDYDPPTTPYLRPEEREELEEGEIDELEYMDDEELEYPPNSSEVDQGDAMTLDSSAGDHLMPHWSPVDAEISDATNGTLVLMSSFTRPLPEPFPAQVMSPTAPFSYPSIWETMLPEPLPSLHQSSSVIMVNTVITDDASSIPRPPKPPLPPVKRRFSQLEGPETSSNSSSSENMVLGASVATTSGSSSFGARTAPGHFTPTTRFMGVLDFHQQEKQAGRHFSSSLSSIQNESSTQNSSPLLQIVSPGRGSEMAELEMYRRPARTMRIVIEDGDDAGDEMSSEEDGRNEMEMNVDESNREFFVDDLESWKADLSIAADLVLQSSLSPRSTAGTLGSSPPSSDATEDDMDLGDDDYQSQGDRYRSLSSENAGDTTRERNGPHTLFNLAHPDRQYVVHALQEASEFIHHPSAVRDSLRYHDHGLSAMRNITMPSPEAIVEQANPDSLPGPGHPLSSNGLVHKVIVSKKLSLSQYPPPLDDYRIHIGKSVELEKGEFQHGVEDLQSPRGDGIH
ncbi:hypothetical protein C8J56DRAFT_886635 [Mycena floridula]|nr:hypothetical protein C8J56DRAFT_886635 [Mycena floridula]